MRELQYPFDGEYLLKKSKKIKKELLETRKEFIPKKIAVFGGSTTHDIVRMLELFLLNQGIRPEFYQSEFGQYWQDAVFGNEVLDSFEPDLVFIHTTQRNISGFPSWEKTPEEIAGLLHGEYARFHQMWEKIFEKYNCPIIQNNFEWPPYRMLGNREAYDHHGRISFISQLNEKFYEYARKNENFHIHDINYLSASYGLTSWSESFYWHMYKYALAVPAIPMFAFNLGNIIKSIYGKNKKALVLDLDNTLWGGVIGDDGPDAIELGQETSMGQVYLEFQEYLKEQKAQGILLNVNSKNEYENAILGMEHPEGALKPEDFIIIKANWETKSKNIIEIAQELNIGTDSLVFIDDNPAEREIIRQQVPDVAVPEVEKPEDYIQIIDSNGYFETTIRTQDDGKRSEMYKANLVRKQQENHFDNYQEFLKSLEMKGAVRAFESFYIPRITQLINKSNQFNLTTRRYSQKEVEAFLQEKDCVTLYGRLSDRFGDHGIVSVLIGKQKDNQLEILLWIMSCRVLRRDMEYAMLDSLIGVCVERNVKQIQGIYIPTAKNKMVKDFYKTMGFAQVGEDSNGKTTWTLEITKSYKKKNKVIILEECNGEDRNT